MSTGSKRKPKQLVRVPPRKQYFLANPILADPISSLLTPSGRGVMDDGACICICDGVDRLPDRESV